MFAVRESGCGVVSELDRYYAAGRRDMRAEILAAIEARESAAVVRSLRAEDDASERDAVREAQCLRDLARAIEVMP